MENESKKSDSQFSKGYEQGIEDGFRKAKSECYDKGHEDGVNDMIKDLSNGNYFSECLKKESYRKGYSQGYQDGHTQAKEITAELDETKLLKSYMSGYNNGVEDTVEEFELGNAFTQNLHEEAFNEGFEEAVEHFNNLPNTERERALQEKSYDGGFLAAVQEFDKCCDEDECTSYEFGDNTESKEHKYPHYYKSVKHLDYIDVYMVNKLFPSNDDTGCVDHTRKKLMVSGGRGGGKLPITDIIEARDTLNRYLEILEQSGELNG